MRSARRDATEDHAARLAALACTVADLELRLRQVRREVPVLPVGWVGAMQELLDEARAYLAAEQADTRRAWCAADDDATGAVTVRWDERGRVRQLRIPG